MWAEIPAALHHQITHAIGLWAATPGWKEEGGRFIPRAAKWLARGWEDRGAPTEPINKDH